MYVIVRFQILCSDFRCLRGDFLRYCLSDQIAFCFWSAKRPISYTAEGYAGRFNNAVIYFKPGCCHHKRIVTWTPSYFFKRPVVV